MTAKLSPTSYDALMNLCKRENHLYRIGHNTHARRNCNTIAIQYHYTIIATVERAESGAMLVMVRVGGWQTNTTKGRINIFLPPGWSLFQRNYSWYLKNRRENETIPFDDAAYFVDNALVK